MNAVNLKKTLLLAYNSSSTSDSKFMLNIFFIVLDQLPLQTYVLTYAAPNVLIFLQMMHQAEISTMRQNTGKAQHVIRKVHLITDVTKQQLLFKLVVKYHTLCRWL